MANKQGSKIKFISRMKMQIKMIRIILIASFW